MQTSKRTLLTIVSEASIERFLLEAIKRLGAHGYTIVEARGAGSHGVRNAEDEQERTIRLEVLCGRDVAETILEYIEQHYYRNYAIIGYLSEVEVLRAEKF